MLKKILLIDDDPGIHLIVVPILSKAGYEVMSATTGEQGLQLALEQRPHLIILDVIMPGMKGREVCAKIKSYEVLKEVKVVFLTAQDSEDEIQAEFAVGAATHITKPVNPPDILAVVKGLIGQAA